MTRLGRGDLFHRGAAIVRGFLRPGLPAARVTSECFSPVLGKPIALGFAPPHAEGMVGLDDGRAARIAALPFYDPERRRPRAAPL